MTRNLILIVLLFQIANLTAQEKKVGHGIVDCWKHSNVNLLSGNIRQYQTIYLFRWNDKYLVRMNIDSVLYPTATKWDSIVVRSMLEVLDHFYYKKNLLVESLRQRYGYLESKVAIESDTLKISGNKFVGEDRHEHTSITSYTKWLPSFQLSNSDSLEINALIYFDTMDIVKLSRKIPKDSIKLAGTWNFYNILETCRDAGKSEPSLTMQFGNDGNYSGQIYKIGTFIPNEPKAEKGRWDLNRKQIFMYKTKHGGRVLSIYKYSDSLMEVETSERHGRVYYRMVKSKDEMPLNIETQTNSKQQLYLVNSMNPKKSFKLDYFTQYSASFDSIKYDNLFHSIDFKIEEVQYGKIKINMHRETKSVIQPNGVYKREDFTFNDYYDTVEIPDSIKFRTIDIDQLKSIIFQPKSRKLLFHLSGGIYMLSSMALLVAAPLVSIKYKSGGFSFNVPRYFKWTKLSLLGTCIGVPIALATAERQYPLTTKANPRKGFWYLEAR